VVAVAAHLLAAVVPLRAADAAADCRLLEKEKARRKPGLFICRTSIHQFPFGIEQLATSVDSRFC
jgi:hypothetical protein